VNRPRKSKGPYPPCFYFKHGAFYLLRQNKWHRLGTDFGLALAEYARRMEGEKRGGMPALIDAALPGILKDKAPTTQAQYTTAAETLKRKLRQFEPADVTQATVYAIQESMRDTPNMANRTLSVLRQVFTYAARKHIVKANPCVGLDRLLEVKRKRLLTGEEWDAIHAAATPRLRVIMELQHLTGQRIGDVLKIRRSQLTAEGIEFEQQKTGARLTVRWSTDLLATVERAKALGGPTTLTLLRNRRGKAPDYRSVHEEWCRACEAAGVLDARPNDGRAMSATTAKRQGKNAQALLGHKSPSMTDRYLRDREAAEVDGPSFRQPLDTRQKG
jgi:integrase